MNIRIKGIFFSINEKFRSINISLILLIYFNSKFTFSVSFISEIPPLKPFLKVVKLGIDFKLNFLFIYFLIFLFI